MKQFCYVAFALLLLSIIVPSVNKIVERNNHSQSVMDVYEAKVQQSFFVTVEAGFQNSRGKTSIVLNDDDNRIALRAGDRLYVRAVISGTAPEKILAGFLTILDPEKGDSKAVFKGALSPYEWVESQSCYVNAKHDFNNLDDPLSECENVFAMLVEKDVDNFKVCPEDKRGSFSVCLAPDVNTLRKKCLEVFGWYDSATNFIALNSDDPATSAPIFNYSISGGLTPNESYNVYYASSSSSADKEFPTYSIGTVTADPEGKVDFACFNYCANDTHVHEIRFVNKRDKNDVKLVTLGMKTVANRVYNITGAASSENHAMAMANSASK